VEEFFKASSVINEDSPVINQVSLYCISGLSLRTQWQQNCFKVLHLARRLQGMATILFFISISLS